MSRCVFDRWNGARQARALSCHRPESCGHDAPARERRNSDRLDPPSSHPKFRSEEPTQLHPLETVLDLNAGMIADLATAPV